MREAGEMEVEAFEIYSTVMLRPPPTGRKRDLGGAILLAAIDDYRSTNEEVHRDAQQFLYAETDEWRNHYDWAVGLAGGVNAAWMRDSLDRLRPQWDAERTQQTEHRRMAVSLRLEGEMTW